MTASTARNADIKGNVEKCFANHASYFSFDVTWVVTKNDIMELGVSLNEGTWNLEVGK